jgi:thiol-disulfide isomerase/thioredoxin/mono/diheme cytochrome c family protein
MPSSPRPQLVHRPGRRPVLRRTALATLFVAASAAAVATARSGATRPDAARPAPVPPAELLLDSVKGTRVSLCRERVGHVATAVVFLSEECPVSRSYAPKVGKLAQEYADQNVAFVVVDCTPHVDAKKAGAFAVANGIASTVLLDPLRAGARRLAVTHAATALLFDPDMKELYRGAIDDQHSRAGSKAHASNDWLVEAIEAELEKRPVDHATTDGPGAELAPVPAGDLTFNEHVAPILHRNCAECHREGQVGPMALLDYDDAKGWAPTIAEVTGQGRMPPWHADPRFGHFVEERRITDTERAILAGWAEAGAKEGDPKKKPAAPVFHDEGWAMGKPDLIVGLPKPENVPADGTVDYRYVLVDPQITEDRWVQEIEIRPTSRAVTHHVLALYIPPGKTPFDMLNGLRDGSVVGAGYFAVQVPGCRPNVFPEGTGKLLQKGARFLFQLHYTPNGKATTDQTQLGLRFCKKKPAREVKTMGIFTVNLRIPPNDPAATFATELAFKKPIDLISMFPHMHVRGTAFKYERVSGPKDERVATTLLDVPKYDFNWQNFYRPEPMDHFDAGDAIRITAVYDNSKGNKFNPNPNKWVGWGDQTFEEMMIGYIDYLEAKE